MNPQFSKHAEEQIIQRSLSKKKIIETIKFPDNIISQENDKVKIYSKLINETEKLYLYRVFINTVKEPMLIITAYKTSKISKYGY